MLKPEIEAALNHQVNNEMWAAYNYLSMTCFCENMNLNGFAAWMKAQRTEELAHAERLIQYILDRGGKVDLAAVKKPQSEYKDIRELFDQALAMEQLNTKAIHDLYSLATKLEDYSTQSHLKWFLDEQVEEEKVFDEVKSLLEMAGDDKSALLLLNEKFGARASVE